MMGLPGIKDMASDINDKALEIRDTASAAGLLDPETSDTTKLAYIGDAVYELYIRGLAVTGAGIKARDMSRFSVGFVRADSQAEVAKALIGGKAEGYSLTDEELSLMKRARNRTNTTAPRGSSEKAYKLATSFEALAGWLYVKGDEKRLGELMEEAVRVTRAI